MYSRPLLRLLLACFASFATFGAASASEFELDDPPVRLRSGWRPANAPASPVRTATSAVGDTTYVGYNPAFAGPTNYWSIGVGSRRPLAGGDNSRRGYWDFDTPLHGDSLQGWVSYRRVYTSTGGLTLPDDQRPWWAVDVGNQTSYVGKSGPANAYGQKPTVGVIGAWHPDPGNVITATIPGTNPTAPSWTPLAGQRSAWCGLRGHGDLTAFDPITGNYYNVATNEQAQFNTLGNGTGTSQRFPGYVGQWDQMLYRDVSIPVTGTVQVRFTYRSNMSTSIGTFNDTRTGWFDKDPLAVVTGNYIRNAPSSVVAPRDSFMVYVGRPVERVVGVNNDWQGSDGFSHDVYDPLRRWFAEVVHVFDGTHHELFTVAGTNAVATQTVTIDAAALAAQGYAGTARLVFRVKTNRGFDDDNASTTGQYNSGYAGAVVLDDIAIDTGSGFQTIGSFEPPASPADSARTIDNNPGYAADQRWKATARPPAAYMHQHDLSTLVYEDLCGQPGSPTRICNMTGGVVSMGDHDRNEAFHGPAGSPEREISDAIVSPVVNLVASGPSTPNEMGITGEMAIATDDICIYYEIYTGTFDFFTTGNSWQPGFQSYPATQSDGSKTWGQVRYTGFEYFNPNRECFANIDLAYGNGLIRTSNPGLQPDSIRIVVRKKGQCFRFGITTGCDDTGGGYLDNMSLVLIDSPLGGQPLTVDIWQWIQDTFPANEDPSLPGLAAFDTCGALIKSGLNIAQTTGNQSRFDIPGDTTVVQAYGANDQVEMVFRVLPGPGNYVAAGDRASGLRVVPSAPTAITSGDGSFWTAYLLDNGASGSPGGHPAGSHAARWSELVWNSARCDTADHIVFPVIARGFGLTALSNPGFASMLHESDPKFSALGQARKQCFLNDTAGPITNINCGSSFDPAPYPPTWVSVVPASRTGWNGSTMTKEGTKIIPDGLLTPGSHVQYFFKRTDLTTLATATVPDTNLVYPQVDEYNYDGHRWQQFSVLPDLWKKQAYGGLGQACALVVDWADRRGDELAWVSIADSTGATAASKRGAHNGWSAPGGADINDPAGFVRNLNQQPGTTWDLYNVKAGESFNAGSGSLGSRLAFRDEANPLNKAAGKVAKNAPTLAMLEAYYRIITTLTGDLNSSLFGPFTDKSQNDKAIYTQWLQGATSTSPRGVWFSGSGFVESLAGDPWLTQLGVQLRSRDYKLLSDQSQLVIDLLPQAQISPSGQTYGLFNVCSTTLDVFQTTGPDAIAASYYENIGSQGPYIAGVLKPAVAPNYWTSLVDGFGIQQLVQMNGSILTHRALYTGSVYQHVFGGICAVTTCPADFASCNLDVPGGDVTLRDYTALRNNPLRSGFAEVVFGLARGDRVEVRIYDVAGRTVRTLADRQFAPGEHLLQWDGTNDDGERLARGVYFTRVRFATRGLMETRKTVVLK